MKRLALALLFVCLLTGRCFAVTSYWVGTTSTSWSDPNNWASISGGVGGTGIVPLTTTDVVLDGNGNTDITANTGTISCNSFVVVSGYTHKLTCTVNINVYGGGVTLVSGITFTANTSAGFRVNASGAWTSNGVVVPVNITNNGGVTITLVDNWTVTGGVTAAVSGTFTINSNTLNITGTLNVGVAMAGTTAIVFGPSGASGWTGTSAITNSITINTSGTFTLANGVILAIGTACSITYTAGTVVSTGNTLKCSGTSATFNTNGMTWNNVSLTGVNPTITLNSLLSVAKTLANSDNNTLVFNGTAGFTCDTLMFTVRTTTMTLQINKTYTVTGKIVLQGLATGNPATLDGANGTIKSSTASTTALLTYTGPLANEWITYMAFTDIDASGGKTLFTYSMVPALLTRTTNIAALTQITPITTVRTSAY